MSVTDVLGEGLKVMRLHLENTQWSKTIISSTLNSKCGR
jgi:hypothetical protein